MTDIEWREGWALGIDLLDEQHRQMVVLLNLLFESDNPVPVGERLDDLIAHLRRHFHTEEVFLRSIDYPDAEEHRREHAIQLAEFIDLRRSLGRSGIVELEMGDREAIRQWFFDHVIAADARFGLYYRETLCGQPRAGLDGG
jgi:hemerythrin